MKNQLFELIFHTNILLVIFNIASFKSYSDNGSTTVIEILCDREEKCYKWQKSIPRNDWCIDFRLPLGYNGIEKCNKLQKSFAKRIDDGDSQRFLFE